MSTITQADLDSWVKQIETAEAAEKAQFDAIIAAIKSGTLPLPDPGTGPVTGPLDGFTGLTLGDPSVWNQTPLMKEDFPTKVPGGQFGAAYKYWFQYPKGWQDTSKRGTYDPARASVVDIGGGLTALRQMVTANSDGSFGGCVLCPSPNGVGYFTDVRYSERVKLTQQDEGHYVMLGWPANDSDWATKSGEPDTIEYDTKNNPIIDGYIHIIGGSSNQDNTNHQVHITSDVKAYDGFHVVTEEMLPSKGTYRRYIDGKLYNVILNPGVTSTAADNAAWAKPVILGSGWKVPGSVPLRKCKQLESNGNKPTRGGVMLDTDWVVIQGLK